MRATDTTPIAPRRGRPPTGQALTSTERNRRRAQRLSIAGGRQLGRVSLSPEAAQALQQLLAGGGTIDEAVSRALVALAHP